MFQLAFGLNPFESGLLTFASALGAISLKFFATTALRLAGFRNVLFFAALAGGVLMAVNAFFTPTTPYWVIVAVLIAAGFTRSLFFTSNSALVFAEIDDRQASQATAIAAVSQQISIALGVASAGIVLEAYHLVTGEAVGQMAFSIAFIAVSMIAATAALPILKLPHNAGMTVSGHLRKKPGEEEPPATV